ncbi:hypothetical protein B7494_g5723 [Chlorociboria aeruginascens]|nr:hypothetical protein B7494_g5723 [Chlorociboria aeruginascens]
MEASPINSTSFNNLPTELREYIWELTFTPRTIQVQIHVRPTSGNPLPSATLPCYAGQVLKTACVVFTFHSGLKETPPRYGAPTSRQAHNPGWYTRMKKPVPHGPAALRVCYESRQVALRHYEQAFGGVKLQSDDDVAFTKAWKEGEYEDRKIWINFEIDEVFLDVERLRWSLNSHLMRLRVKALWLLSRFAREEVKKIRRLGITKIWEHGDNSSVPGPMVSSRRKPRLDLDELREFEKVQELLVYHIEPRFAKTPGSEEELELDIIGALKRMKEEDLDWKLDIPMVTIKSGHRYGYNGN